MNETLSLKNEDEELLSVFLFRGVQVNVARFITEQKTVLQMKSNRRKIKWQVKPHTL